MRLAWFTPLAPVPSGIATISAMVLPALSRAHAIDIYVDDGVWAARRTAAARDPDGYWAVPDTLGTIRPAHDFVPRQFCHPYGLTVYQMGNAACHDYMWPYLMRYPGLVVLHDAQVHQARARALLAAGRTADYRAEFAFSHPGAPPEVADWVISGLGNAAAPIWPLTAALLRAARAVAVHFPVLAADLREDLPDVPVHVVRLGAPDLLEGQTPLAAGFPVDDEVARPQPAGVTFAAFGLVTPEKRIPQILGALAAIRTVAPTVRLRLVGPIAPHYDAFADATRLEVADLVTITGHVDDETFDRELVRSDVCLCLRWPTNREASGPWLRALAAGRPTVINDLAHLVDVPAADPRTWTVQAARTDGAAATRTPALDEAVAVAVDILDEDHSLALAMRRLALDAELRASLGRAARRFWAEGHTIAHMTEDYERVIAAAAAAPDPVRTAGLPPHLHADGSGLVRRLAAEVGVEVDFL